MEKGLLEKHQTSTRTVPMRQGHGSVCTLEGKISVNIPQWAKGSFLRNKFQFF